MTPLIHASRKIQRHRLREVPTSRAFGEGLIRFNEPDAQIRIDRHLLEAFHSGIVADTIPYSYNLYAPSGEHIHWVGWFTTVADAVADAKDWLAARAECSEAAMEWVTTDEAALAKVENERE